MLERLAAYVDANPGSQLWIASSMGQRATMAETRETQAYLTDPHRFLEAMGLPGEDVWEGRPAMMPHFNLVVEDKERGSLFRDALRTVRVGGGTPPFKESANGFFSLEFGQANLHDRPDVVTVGGEPGLSPPWAWRRWRSRTAPCGTTAYHVPEGILAIYDPSRPPATTVGRPEVSVLDVAPAILQTLGVDPPAYMTRPKLLAELATP